MSNKVVKFKKDNDVNKEKIKRLMEESMIYNVNGKKVKIDYKEKYYLRKVVELGYKEAKKWIIDYKSKSTFFRLQRGLREKGIELKNLPDDICKRLKEEIQKDKMLFPKVDYSVEFEM